jgi:hypothetical protein
MGEGRSLSVRWGSEASLLRKELALMRRFNLVVALAVVLVATMALTVGSALAKDTQPKPETYTDAVVTKQYFARGPSAANLVGIGMFRGEAKDIEGDGDPGLTGELDARITYTGGAPGPGVKNTVNGGAWMLCSEFRADPDPRSLPECKPSSAIVLHGTVSSGTAEWDEDGGYADVLTPSGVISVYAGQAEVEGVFTVTGGTVNNEPVNGGSGKFEGTLDHHPLLDGEPPILEGTLELKF